MNPSAHHAVLSAAFLLAGLFSGCETMPPLNFNPPNVGATSRRLDAELKAIVVTVARPDERRGPLRFQFEYSKTIPDLWKTGLEDSLNRMLVFRDENPRKVNLNVKILAWHARTFGSTLATATARYEIIDRTDGTIYFTGEFTSEGAAPISFALDRGTRTVEAANRAAQNNISLFLKQLETLDLSKPMFPANRL